MEPAVKLVFGLTVAAWTAAWALGLGPVAAVLKPLPVLVLAVAAARGGAPRPFVAGLALGAVGDVAIDLDFLAGMAFFAAAHVAYLVGLLGLSRRPALGWLPAFATWGAGLLSVCWAGFGALAVPVAAYATLLCGMMWRAAAVGGVVAVGAVVFGVSDSLIALGLGGHPAFDHPLAVMSTYWGGQALLAWGAASFVRKS